MARVDAAEVATRTPRAESRAERAFVPVRYALRRLRRNGARTLVAALGIAVGAAVLALTQIGSTAAQDRAVQRALSQLQPSDRAIQTVWSGVPAQSSLSLRKLDALARAATTPIIGRPPFRVEVFRQATWGGAYVNLGAVDNLRKWIRMVHGRVPRPCRPQDCELVQIGGKAVTPHIPGLYVVGRATFLPGAPLAQYFGAGGERRPPILVASGVLRFSRFPLPDGGLVARTYGWIVPVTPSSVHDWQLATLAQRIDRAQADLERRSDIFSVAGPTDTIQAIRATSRVAAGRLLILGGDAAVLLLGFAVLASARLRRDHKDVRQRLTWSGATRVQILSVAATESLVITVAASVVGWLAGIGAGALLARHLSAPPGLTVTHSLATGRTVGIALGLAALTAVVMLVALRADELAIGGARITVADTAAIGALAAVLLALARGKADALSLQQGGTGVLLLLLPALVLFVLAVAAARILGPLLRALEWSSRRAPMSLRIALLSLARAPGEVVLAVVFFVLSIGIAVFALAYRATLMQGEHDQARYAVPAPYVLQEDLTRLVTIQQAASDVPGTRVLRDSGAAGGSDFTLLALPARALPHIDGWRSDFSRQSPAQLARLIRPTSSMRLNGVPVPQTFRFTIAGDRIGLALVVRLPRGDFAQVNLGEHGPGTYAKPTHLRRGTLIAVRLSFPTIAAYVASHKEAETSQVVADAAVGTLRIPVHWLGFGGIRVGAPGTYHYVVNRANDSIIRPSQPADGELVPVIASPAIGKIGETVGLRVSDTVLSATVVAHTRYFPSVDGDVVVADLPTWLAAVNSAEPGVAAPSEIWATQPPVRQLPLQMTSQRDQESLLRGDPIARGAIALLLIVALVALALAVAGLILTVLGDRSGERSSLQDLSVQGATPAELRRHLRLRAAVVGILGIGGGLGAGAIVGTLVVAVVTVTAGAQQALPPLARVFDWPLIALALGVVVLVSAAGARAVTRR